MLHAQYVMYKCTVYVLVAIATKSVKQADFTFVHAHIKILNWDCRRLVWDCTGQVTMDN